MRFYGLAPGTLAIAALAGVVVLVVLYTVRWRLPQRVVGTTTLWREVMARHRGGGRLGALDHVLSLLGQLLIFLLLVLALGQPRFSCQSAGGRAVVIVLDRSASMATMERVEPRYDKAKRRALDRLATTAATDRVGLVLAGGDPEIAAPLGSMSSQVRQAIEASSVTAKSGELHRAVALACDLLHDSKDASLVLVSDGTELPGTCAGVAFEQILVGAAHPNVGITAFSTGFPPRDASRADAFVEVLDAWNTPAHVELRIDLDGKLVAVSQLELEPGVPVTRTFPGIPLTGAGRLEARLTSVSFDGGGKDALRDDDVAFAVIPLRNKIAIDLVGQSEPLRLVLSANPRYVVTPRTEMSESRGAIQVVAGDVRGTLSAGRYLLVNPSGPALPFTFGGTQKGIAISDSNDDHPILRRVILSDVFIRAATKTILPASGTAIVRSSTTPLLYTYVDGPVRAVGLAFDLLDTDLPLRVGFPVLIYNAIDWLEHAGSTDDAEPAVVRSDAALDVTTPGGAVRRLQPVEGRVRIPLGEPGFYEVRSLARQPITTLAMSVSSAVETRNAPAATTPGEGNATVVKAGRALDREPGTWLLLAAFFLLLVEWLTYHRRITV